MFRNSHQSPPLDISELADGLPWMVWLSDDDPGCRWINRSWIEFGGFSKDDQVGRAWLSSIHPDDLDEFGRTISDAYLNQVPYSVKYRYRNKLGDYVLIHDRGYPRVQDNGSLTGFVGFCTDDSDVQSSPPSDTVGTSYSALPVGIVVWDANLKVHELNRVAAELFATNSSAASGKCLSLITGINRESLLRSFATLTTLRQGEERSTVDFLSDVPGQGLRSFDWHNSLIGDRNRENQRVVSVIIDTTDRKLRPSAPSTIEEQFRLATANVKCMAYEWRRDSGKVSRSPGLFELVGYSPEELEPTIEAWEQFIHPDDIESFRASFFKQVAGQSKLVDSHYRVLHRDGNVRHVWDRALIDYDETGTPQRIAGFSTDVSELMLTQQNLQQSEERFRVATEAIEGMVYEWDLRSNIVIRSAGFESLTGRRTIDIPKTISWWIENLHHDDRLTYESTMNDAVTQSLESVTVDYRLKHASNGYIEVRDRCRILYDRQGTPVQIIGCVSPIVRPYFDEISCSGTDKSVDSAPPAEKKGSGLRVLVVDDYPSSADSLGKLLQLVGHEVDVAYDAHGALQLGSKKAHDVVFLDIGLPKTSGYDVARQLRSLRKDDFIIAALTGWGDAQSRSRSAEAGINYHFTKPISDGDLDHVLQAALKKLNLKEEL